MNSTETAANDSTAHAPPCAYIYTLDPDTLFDEFRQRGVLFVKELSFIDDGLWGFEITDADGYVLAFLQLRNQYGRPLSLAG